MDANGRMTPDELEVGRKLRAMLNEASPSEMLIGLAAAFDQYRADFVLGASDAGVLIENAVPKLVEMASVEKVMAKARKPKRA